MFLLEPLLRLGRDLRARCLLAYGRALLRCGRTEAARVTFQRVLELRGEDFYAYVHLGEIALREGNVTAAARELRAASRTNPERFARLRSRLASALDSLAAPQPDTPPTSAWPVGPTANGATPRSGPATWLGPSWASVEPGRAAARPAGDTRGEPKHVTDARRGPGDFTSEAEAVRFRDQPPIAREEWQALDWDDLARRLSA